MGSPFQGITGAQWRAFVADVADALELREGDRIFDVRCGDGAFLRPLYEAGCVVGGIDADAALIDIARRDMPDGEWSVGGLATLDASLVRRSLGEGGAPWDVVVACSVLDRSSTLTAAADLLEQMVRKATAAVAVLDVPSGLAFDERWFLRSLSAFGVASVRLPALRIDGNETSAPRFNVIARLR